ncbi:MAG: HPr family phosphocarrier protein [candidate division Zixibacteria bacterium]|nr:HPr family phosphocarrier protein [candidate division Zixibacteria bacterium]
MITATVRIINKLGLHARPSAMLVTATSAWQSEVFFTKENVRVNGKSIMGVMMLAAEKGSEIIVEVDGPDEEEALEAICKVIRSGFNETD